MAVYNMPFPAGLSSFYSELMKGIGASGRLWQLIDRTPTIPLSGELTSDLCLSDLLSGPLSLQLHPFCLVRPVTVKLENNENLSQRISCKIMINHKFTTNKFSCQLNISLF